MVLTPINKTKKHEKMSATMKGLTIASFVMVLVMFAMSLYGMYEANAAKKEGEGAK